MSPDADLLLGALGAGASTELRLVCLLSRRTGADYDAATDRVKNAIVELVQAGRVEMPSSGFYRLTEAAAGKDAPDPQAAHRRRLPKR